ncbi:hypothetical protein Tco_0593368, partial [Tanacetum coccineum]
MAKQVKLNKKKGKGTGQGENRPVWNNVQRLNHQNKFVPKAVNTARQNLSSQAATTSTARKVNTARPIVNEIRPRNNFCKSHSPIKRPFNRTTAPKANFSNQKVNIAKVKAVSAVGGKREPVVKPSAVRRWTLDDMMMIWGSLYSFLRATYGAELVSAASLINTARPKLSTARLGWCCSKVFNNGVDAWIGSKMQFGLDLRFWNTASFQTVNDEKKIQATIDSKAVVVTEASIRSCLLLHDVVGTACLTNEAIFQNLALMGYEGELNKLTFQKALFSPQWKYLIHTILHCLSSKSTSWNEFSTNIASAVPHQAPEGECSKQPTEPQPTPSPTQPSTGDQPPMTNSSSSHDTTQDYRDSLEGTNGIAVDQVQPSHYSNLLGGMTLEELYVLCTNLAWLRSTSRLYMKRKLGRKESISKHGRKNAKPEPTLDDNTFDDLDADHGMVYMDTKEPVNEGRLSKETEELNVTHDTEVLEKGGSNKEPVSDAGNIGPLPSIDPKDKGKGVLKESPVKKVKRSDLDAAQIAKDVEVARLVYEEELVELEKEKEERQRQEQASVEYIANLYDEVQAKIDASEELAARLQMEEREMY